MVYGRGANLLVGCYQGGLHVFSDLQKVPLLNTIPYCNEIVLKCRVSQFYWGPAIDIFLRPQGPIIRINMHKPSYKVYILVYDGNMEDIVFLDIKAFQVTLKFSVQVHEGVKLIEGY